jgi:hypothetical protein
VAIGTKTTYTLDEFGAELEESARLADELPIARDLQDEITELVYAGVQRNYDEKVDSNGIPWAPHAPMTIALYGVHPLLILSGTMWVASTMTGVEGNYLEVSDRQIVTGVDLPYAANQQFGTDRIPAREFYYIQDSYAYEIENLAAAYSIQEVLG